MWNWYRFPTSSAGWNHHKEVLEVDVCFAGAFDQVVMFSSSGNDQLPSPWPWVIYLVDGSVGQRNLPWSNRSPFRISEIDAWAHSFGWNWDDDLFCGIIHKNTVWIGRSPWTSLHLPTWAPTISFYKASSSCKCNACNTRQFLQLVAIGKFEHLTTCLTGQFLKWPIRRVATQSSRKEVYCDTIISSKHQYFGNIIACCIFCRCVSENIKRRTIIWAFSHTV